ncbi:MAG: nuclease, partial [Acidobacteria bacterium]|nr:nuclease [Acidobacteriota bacterium]
EYRALTQEKKRTAEVEQKIVFYGGWLGHYVADGSQPMHATIHHHGWVGENPNQYTTDGKIHSQFESVYVAANLKARDFQDLVQAPVRLADPFADYVKYLRESNQQIEEFYKLEKTGAFAGPGTRAGHEFTRRCLARGSQMLLNLWYTAWLESADPAPPRPSASPYTSPPPKYPMAPPPAPAPK